MFVFCGKSLNCCKYLQNKESLCLADGLFHRQTSHVCVKELVLLFPVVLQHNFEELLCRRRAGEAAV